MALRATLENTEIPLIVNNRSSKWKIITYSEQEWCQLFGLDSLKFRVGNFNFSNSPQWERTCGETAMTLKQFFDKSRNVHDEWYYYDYKGMSDVFGSQREIYDAFNWSDLGFPDLQSKDSTLWIGNRGAHTPCHMDAHGFNLVAQIYGRKMWILIDPQEMVKLEPTRVPYEETTIYSGLNFFTPNKKFLNLSNVYKIVLEPGQVLCVPRHWWHYVENLEAAISVNTWIPCDVDIESQMDEALVQKFVSNFNQHEKLVSLCDSGVVTDSVLEHLAMKCLEYRSREKSKTTVIRDDVSNVSKLSPMTQTNLNDYVSAKSTKYSYDFSKTENEPASCSKKIINAFCHPDVVKVARNHFLQQFKN